MIAHDLLLNEPDRTVALVIAHAPLDLGADILVQFAPDRQSEIIRQLVTFRPDTTRDRSEWLAHIPSEMIGGIYHAVRLLEIVDIITRQMILDGLSRHAPALADEIRQNILAFEEIGQLADQDIQCLLKNVNNSQWLIALKGANEELKDRLFANMSKRAAVLLQEDMKYRGPVRSSEVEKAQREITHIVHLLIDAGEVSHPVKLRRTLRT